MSDEQPSREAEVLRLGLIEGQSVRAISRRLAMSRKTVRRILGRQQKRKAKPAAAGRASILDVYEADIRQMLSNTPDLRAPAILERLREKGLRWWDHYPSRSHPYPAPARAHGSIFDA